jgi:hypothetical protein
MPEALRTENLRRAVPAAQVTAWRGEARGPPEGTHQAILVQAHQNAVRLFELRLMGAGGKRDIPIAELLEWLSMLSCSARRGGHSRCLGARGHELAVAPTA